MEPEGVETSPSPTRYSGEFKLGLVRRVQETGSNFEVPGDTQLLANQCHSPYVAERPGH